MVCTLLCIGSQRIAAKLTRSNCSTKELPSAAANINNDGSSDPVPPSIDAILLSAVEITMFCFGTTQILAKGRETLEHPENRDDHALKSQTDNETNQKAWGSAASLGVSIDISSLSQVWQL